LGKQSLKTQKGPTGIKPEITKALENSNSRVTDLIKRCALGHPTLGASKTDMFFIAFKFPHLFRRILLKGALHRAF